MANKKLLIATGIFPPDIGGPATYTETLLAELPKRGFDVRVITYADKELEIRNNNLEISRINRNQNILFRYLKYFLAIWKLLSWSDIIYIQDPISAGLPAALASRLRRRKYFLKIVGDYAWEQGQQKYAVAEQLDYFQVKRYGSNVELLRRLQRWTARGAERIIVPSRYLKNIVQKWGIDGSKIQVIYNSVRRAQSEKSKEELRRELKLEGDVIVSVARLVPWKGFDALINLMPDLLEINPGFKLFIIGSGPEIKNYELRIKNYGLEDKVKLLGALEQAKLWQYMKASDYFVLNTGYEGLPHIVIEAMYLGVPVITTLVGGNVEVVENGRNGLLVEYNNTEQIKNAIIRLWQDHALARELAVKAQEGLEKFSVGRMVDEVVNLF